MASDGFPELGEIHEQGNFYVRLIINRRLTKCLGRGGHYPFTQNPIVYDPSMMLFKPQPPTPANCARCGIGGPYQINFDNAGRPMNAELL
jgi:hypothetical protein